MVFAGVTEVLLDYTTAHEARVGGSTLRATALGKGGPCCVEEESGVLFLSVPKAHEVLAVVVE